MLGTGSLNGAELNADPVNGGHFVLEAAGAATMVVAAAVVATRRARGTAVLGVSANASLLANRRQRWSGTTTANVAASAVGRRRAVAAGSSTATVNATTNARRRLPAVGTSAVTITCTGDAAWRFIHRSPRQRTFALGEDARLARLPLDGRAVVVPSQPAFTVPRDPREAP